jgi:hypothetical protein
MNEMAHFPNPMNHDGGNGAEKRNRRNQPASPLRVMEPGLLELPSQQG